MDSKYIVVGWGFNKEDGKPYSRCAKIVSDYKEGKYEFIDMKNSVFLEHHEKVGKIISANITFN